MKHLVSALFLCCALVFSLHAQTMRFQKTFAGGSYTIGRDVIQTADGGYAYTGYANNIGVGIENMYLVKTDAGGDTLWTRTYGGSQNEESFSLAQTDDGGYILTGSTSSFTPGQEDVYLVRTNSTGDTLWTRAYGGTNFDKGMSVIQCEDGGFMVTGETLSYGSGNHDQYIIKTDGAGELLWTKVLGVGSDDYGYCVRQTSDNGYITSGGSTFGAFVVKTDEAGDTLWSRGYVASGPPHLNPGYAIEQTNDQGYIVIGIASGAGGMESCVNKIDPDGDLEWSKTYSSTNHVYTTSGQQTADGGYIFGGWSQAFPVGYYRGLLIRTDALGDTLWTRLFTGGASVSSVKQTTDGGFIFLTSNNYTTFLNKTDSLGQTGCDLGPAWPIVSEPETVVTDPAYTITTGGTKALHPWMVESGGTLGTLCFECDLVVSMEALPDTICMEDGTLPLFGSPAGGTFTGDGVSGLVFSPQQAGFGWHDIVYSFSLSAGCAGTDTSHVFVSSTGDPEAPCFQCNLNVSFNALPDTVCIDGPSWPLVGNPSDGTFSGEGVSGTNFYPDEAGIGLHELIYSYSLTEDCFGSDTVWVVVDVCTGLEEYTSMNDLFLFPNPVNDQLQIEYQGILQNEVGYVIYNATGEEVRSGMMTSRALVIDTRNWAPGMYSFHLDGTTGAHARTFFVVH